MSLEDHHLNVDNVVAGYLPEVDILRGCSLTVEAGELVGIIGPNGAGKSTLLKALFGLVPIRSGTVVFNGEQIHNLRPHQLVSRNVGFVPQTNNVFSALTVKENLEMGCFPTPDMFDKAYEHVVSMFPKLGERHFQKAGSLSGGERQMLAIGRALIASPQMLLLDEPSAGLSPDLQDGVFSNVENVNAAGITVILVEQNAHRCLEICDRAFVLDQGKQAYEGTGSELLNDPKIAELYLGGERVGAPTHDS